MTFQTVSSCLFITKLKRGESILLFARQSFFRFRFFVPHSLQYRLRPGYGFFFSDGGLPVRHAVISSQRCAEIQANRFNFWLISTESSLALSGSWESWTGAGASNALLAFFLESRLMP
jgi:hypothetical protein